MYDIFNFVHNEYLSIIELQEKFNILIRTMEYNFLISSIPKAWLRSIKEGTVNRIVKIDALRVKLNKLYKNVRKVHCKEFYSIFVRKKITPVTCISKWETLYEDLTFDWSGIYCCSFENTRETTLQSFQYKVINRYIPCNINLHRWKKSESDLCCYCGSLETIEHFLYECNLTRSLWSGFFEWWQTVTKTYISCSLLDILFGIANPEKNPEIIILNFCIIFVKYYIYKSKIHGKNTNLQWMKREMKDKILCEKCILLQQNKHSEYYKLWHPILQKL